LGVAGAVRAAVTVKEILSEVEKGRILTDQRFNYLTMVRYREGKKWNGQ
jgi:hypothetical protein